MKNIYQIDHKQARTFFITADNYCNVDLPKYVNFQPLLDEVDTKLEGHDLSSWHSSSLKPHDDDKVNYRLLGNKDSDYAWRPYELINPAIYVDIVHLITNEQNWYEITERFSYFAKNNIIKCCSIPLVKRHRTTQKGTQILSWWEGVEQESLKLSLKFNYVFDADISNCYGSIYTHSIAWAMHGKVKARADKNMKLLLGSKIDQKFQAMRYGQTNGIPQGSGLSDFVAELVLGYIDELISEKIKQHSPRLAVNEFRILRYRDDYKIFTNRPELGKKLLRYISEILSDFGMHLNTSKTKESSDPVIASVKADKIDELFVTPREDNYAKWLLQIYATISKHPNSGKAVRQLNYFHKQLHLKHSSKDKLHSYEKADVMLGIVTNIAIRNPKYYNWSVAIISILLDYTAKSNRRGTASSIVHKFENTPNTGLLDIWLQRATFPEHPNRKYSEPFCKLVTLDKYPGNELLWSLSWLAEPSLKRIINKTRIIDRNQLAKLKTVIDREETDSFKTQPS
ncbi:MAG: Magnesium/nickel/cobalt transporter CorA [Candidatus Saccharibacteria bacterium GW2011_GWC2_48_9]|nr:MAG: Magnesium/nickel/cobalt transporter CorA [Candidatus Saccharibacteria bacterium GW2011_GWC2_48_9]HCH34023.1 reverse transcriptase [Candidatus Saccharibacteria bacterium]